MGCVGDSRVLEIVNHNPDDPLDSLFLVAKPVEEDNYWILNKLDSPFFVLAIVNLLDVDLGKRDVLKDRLESEVVEHLLKFCLGQFLPRTKVEPESFVFECVRSKLSPKRHAQSWWTHLRFLPDFGENETPYQGPGF